MIDFNGLTHGLAVTNQFPGISFSLLGSPPTAGPIAYALTDGTVANTGNPVSIFGATGLAISPGVVTTTINPPFFDIQISFSAPIDFFSIMALDAEEQFTLSGFLGGALVQSVGPTSNSFVGNRGASPFRGPVYNPTLGAIGGSRLFDRVVIGLVAGDGPELYDNMVFNAVTVPEPSTLAVFAIGLVGFSFATRRANLIKSSWKDLARRLGNAPKHPGKVAVPVYPL